MKIGNETINICRPTRSRNVTMTSTAEVRITLGELISVPNDTKSLEYLTKYKFKLGGK
jgi:hypothetical protein